MGHEEPKFENVEDEAREIVMACLTELRRRYPYDIQILNTLQDIEDLVECIIWNNP